MQDQQLNQKKKNKQQIISTKDIVRTESLEV
jgi:hypothetical protein